MAKLTTGHGTQLDNTKHSVTLPPVVPESAPKSASLTDGMSEGEAPLQLGETPLIHARALEPLLGFGDSNIYIKNEGANPTTTHKDRVALLLVQRAKEQGCEEVVAATCGNYGEAIAHFAQKMGLRCTIFVSQEGLSNRDVKVNVQKIVSSGAQVVEVRGPYARAVKKSEDYIRNAGDSKVFDANPGVETHVDLETQGYAAIAREICRQLKKVGREPDLIAVPVGNGTLLKGIYHGLREMLLAHEIQRLPELIACSSAGGNSVIQSFYDWHHGSRKYREYRGSIRVTPANAALAGEHCADGAEALKALVSCPADVCCATDTELFRYAKLVKMAMHQQRESLNPIPVATAGIKALERVVAEGRRIDRGTYVVIVTGERE